MPSRQYLCPTALVEVVAPAPLLGPLAGRLNPVAEPSEELTGWPPTVAVTVELSGRAVCRRLAEQVRKRVGETGLQVRAAGGRLYRRWDLPDGNWLLAAVSGSGG